MPKIAYFKGVLVQKKEISILNGRKKDLKIVLNNNFNYLMENIWFYYTYEFKIIATAISS